MYHLSKGIANLILVNVVNSSLSMFQEICLMKIFWKLIRNIYIFGSYIYSSRIPPINQDLGLVLGIWEELMV